MVRPVLALFFLGSVAAVILSPCAAQAPAQSAAIKECLRLDAQPADTIPWDQHERVYKQWVEVCRQAMTTDGGNIRIKKAMERAFGATGQRAEEIILLREMAAQGDAESYMDIYEMYKSFYRGHVDKPQLVKRAEAEQSLRKAAEAGHPFATMMLAILLDRGSTVKRDPEEAIVWAERAVANPARSPDPIKDVRPIDVQVLLGRLLVKSSDAVRKARGIALLERLGPQGRGDATAYLAEAIRTSDPVRARALLEQAVRTYPGAALAPLADMLVKGEGGPKDEKRALSLLRGRSARGAQYAQAYLGQLTLEGRLVKRDVAEAVRLITPWSQWDYDTQLQLARLLAENPDIEVTYAGHLVSELTEAGELGEPGALPTLIALKLSRNNQFRDEAGGCKLVTEAASRGDNDAARRVPECNAITAKIRGFAAYQKDDLDSAIADYGEAIKADAKYADAFLYRGIAWHAKKDFDRAIADYTVAIELEPTPLAYLDRGIALAIKRDLDRAIADYDAAIRLFPKYTEAYYWRGHAWKDKGSFDRATADYNEAIRLDPKYIDAYYGRGHAYFYTGKFAVAAADFMRATDLGGNAYAMVWRFLARARAGEDGVAELSTNAARLKTKDWPYAVIGFYLGHRTLNEMRDAAANADKKCEAAFYAGEWHLLHNNKVDAKPMFQSAADTCPESFVEYSGAVAELRRF
jgi:tetratricopeptide (TPR) repeat protein